MTVHLLDGQPWNPEWASTYAADAEAARLERLPTLNRSKRNDLLAATDWWAVGDRTMTAEQTAYRQALRDLTSHVNWPDLQDADWPTKP
jgi:hypothetical protein